MGMYDDIRIEIECPTCNTKIKGFQSKDGDCGMHLLEFWEVNNFYCSCPVCHTWIEYDIKQRPNRRLTIDDYYRSIKVPSKKELKKREKQMEELKELFAKNKQEVKKNE